MVYSWIKTTHCPVQYSKADFQYVFEFREKEIKLLLRWFDAASHSSESDTIGRKSESTVLCESQRRFFSCHLVFDCLFTEMDSWWDIILFVFSPGIIHYKATLHVFFLFARDFDLERDSILGGNNGETGFTPWPTAHYCWSQHFSGRCVLERDCETEECEVQV